MLPHQAALRPTGRRQGVEDLVVHNDGDGVWHSGRGVNDGSSKVLHGGCLADRGTVDPAVARN